MSKKHLPCPCGESSDAYSIQDNGWGKCFSCDKNFPPNRANKDKETDIDSESPQAAAPKPGKPITPITSPSSGFPERGLSKNTLARYKCHVNDKGHFICPITKDGVHTGNKARLKGKKDFPQEGDVKKADLFGQSIFLPGSAKYVTITEGYEDAMAAHEVMGSRYPFVSVHGASSALEDCRRNFEYLNSFENVILCLDNDEHGIKATKAVCTLPFPPGKLKIVKLKEHKDASDYKKNGDGEKFSKEWWNPTTYKPDGILKGPEIWEKIIDRKDQFTVPYPFESWNKMTYGIRLSETTIITAPTGVGKTSIVKHIEHCLLTNEELKEKNYGVGFLHFEEPVGDVGLGLLGVHIGKPLHLPDTPRDVDELRSAYDELLNNDRVVIWDHFGSNSIDTVLDKVRYMYASGCRYFVIDHLSIIVSDQSGDERKQLDEISTKLKTMCMELNIAIIAVVHMNRQGEIRGTAGIEQLANTIVFLDRDKKEKDPWRRNITSVIIDKNRFCGRTGPAGFLHYNEDTSRITELTKEEGEMYENGMKPGDDMIPF